jgi:hypothetical protein
MEHTLPGCVKDVGPSFSDADMTSFAVQGAIVPPLPEKSLVGRFEYVTPLIFHVLP